MEKEKLLDKLKNFFRIDGFNKYCTTNMLYFVLLVVLNIFSKNLFLLMILTTIVYLSWLLSEITNDENKYVKIVIQSYLVLSSYSFLYISINFSNSKTIYLWLLILISSIKILEYFLDEILVDENNKKFRLTKFVINSIMIVMLSIVYSVFMRQKIMASLLVNFIAYFLMFLTHIIPEKYQKNAFLMCYNTIAFPVIFICISLISGILSIK